MKSRIPTKLIILPKKIKLLITKESIKKQLSSNSLVRNAMDVQIF